MPFNYEDTVNVLLAQHNRRIHWLVACTTQSMHMWWKQTF